MSAITRKKVYLPDSVYHITCRGVNKQNIFHSNKDYLYYEQCLREYLTPKNELIKLLKDCGYSQTNIDRKLLSLSRIKSYVGKVTLLSYCLMPNHIHLQILQKDYMDMSRFMKSLHTRYGKYYSKKHKHLGPLYQDRYAGSLINGDIHHLNVSRYIHLNPRDLGVDPFSYRWSSLRFYKAQKTPSWIDMKITREIFAKSSMGTVCNGYTDWIKDSL